MSRETHETGLIVRSLRASAGLGLLATLFLIVYAGPGPALHYAAFATWSVVNLAIWSAGLRELLERRRMVVVLALGATKVAWLGAIVALAAVLGMRGWARLLSFLAGVNTPLLVVCLKAIGAQMTRTEESPPETTGKAARVSDGDPQGPQES